MTVKQELEDLRLQMKSHRNHEIENLKARHDEMRREDSKRREIELNNLRAEMQEHQQNVSATYFQHTLTQVITFLRKRGLIRQGLEF